MQTNIQKIREAITLILRKNKSDAKYNIRPMPHKTGVGLEVSFSGPEDDASKIAKIVSSGLLDESGALSVKADGRFVNIYYVMGEVAPSVILKCQSGEYLVDINKRQDILVNFGSLNLKNQYPTISDARLVCNANFIVNILRYNQGYVHHAVTINDASLEIFQGLASDDAISGGRGQVQRWQRLWNAHIPDHRATFARNRLFRVGHAIDLLKVLGSTVEELKYLSEISNEEAENFSKEANKRGLMSISKTGKYLKGKNTRIICDDEHFYSDFSRLCARVFYDAVDEYDRTVYVTMHSENNMLEAIEANKVMFPSFKPDIVLTQPVIFVGSADGPQNNFPMMSIINGMTKVLQSRYLMDENKLLGLASGVIVLKILQDSPGTVVKLFEKDMVDLNYFRKELQIYETFIGLTNYLNSNRGDVADFDDVDTWYNMTVLEEELVDILSRYQDLMVRINESLNPAHMVHYLGELTNAFRRWFKTKDNWLESDMDRCMHVCKATYGVMRHCYMTLCLPFVPMN